MKVILISGKAQHGKDTAANFLKMQLCSLNTECRVKITHLGDLLKYMCREYGHWDGNKDKSGRSILQRIGTDVVRAEYPTYWVDFIANIIKWFDNDWDFFIIPDIRFHNELDVLKAYPTITIRIDRPNFDNGLTASQKIHPSEVDLDNYLNWSIQINNDSDLSKLQLKCNRIAEQLLYNQVIFDGTK